MPWARGRGALGSRLSALLCAHDCAPDIPEAAMAAAAVAQWVGAAVDDSAAEWVMSLSTKQIHMSVHMSMHTSMRRSIHMSIHMSVHMSIHMSIHMSVHMSVCMTIHRLASVASGAPRRPGDRILR